MAWDKKFGRVELQNNTCCFVQLHHDESYEDHAHA
ncbi:hypothetical protein LINGRAHAP2_LOCUS28439 [Linum grandiflorum]